MRDWGFRASGEGGGRAGRELQAGPAPPSPRGACGRSCFLSSRVWPAGWTLLEGFADLAAKAREIRSGAGDAFYFVKISSRFCSHFWVCFIAIRLGKKTYAWSFEASLVLTYLILEDFCPTLMVATGK